MNSSNNDVVFSNNNEKRDIISDKETGKKSILKISGKTKVEIGKKIKLTAVTKNIKSKKIVWKIGNCETIS